ncbi:hypothetical protein FRC00_003003 [Tulasnella sp. 408]|nr:hypothetical protein FRC00_003003 [Tulasnella sp. 408]
MTFGSARILLRQGNRYTAARNLSKIYGNATPEEIEQRVRLMEDSVQESIRITKQTTFTQRFMSVFLHSNVPGQLNSTPLA